jgi:hypothetical protein
MLRWGEKDSCLATTSNLAAPYFPTEGSEFGSARDAASFVTGHPLAVDGGLVAQ